jgi:hypothetical protein
MSRNWDLFVKEASRQTHQMRGLIALERKIVEVQKKRGGQLVFRLRNCMDQPFYLQLSLYIGLLNIGM